MSCLFCITATHNHQRSRALTTKQAAPANSSQIETASDLLKTRALSNADAWEVLKKFAAGELTLPQVEEKLRNILGDRYVHIEWKPAYDAVFSAEDDECEALTAITKLAMDALARKSDQVLQPSIATTAQLREAETTLLESVNELHRRKRIFGTAPTLEDLLNPIEEQQVGENLYHFDGANDIEVESQIVSAVKGESTNEGEESTEEDGDEDEEEDRPSCTEIMKLCAQLEKICMSDTDLTGEAFDLSQLLRKYRGQVFKQDMQSRKQVTLDLLWSREQAQGGDIV